MLVREEKEDRQKEGEEKVILGRKEEKRLCLEGGEAYAGNGHLYGHVTSRCY